eukprot:TRINITY_DN36554_c0_g1_i1.p1 TRINITY_DN36554_c0_g1~~TRINITY_DN36554_c0_g1_i1.p1  ORF type:complete len:100 (+),score=17.18 TRINITY_DN36554_c0_g1_i1:78-377(+)
MKALQFLLLVGYAACLPQRYQRFYSGYGYNRYNGYNRYGGYRKPFTAFNSAQTARLSTGSNAAKNTVFSDLEKSNADKYSKRALSSPLTADSRIKVSLT